MSGDTLHNVPSWLSRIVDAVAGAGCEVVTMPSSLAHAQPLLDCVAAAVDARCISLSVARQQGYADGRAIERQRCDEVLKLLGVAVAARRRRMQLDDDDAYIEVQCQAEDLETRAICVLLDYAELHPAP